MNDSVTTTYNRGLWQKPLNWLSINTILIDDTIPQTNQTIFALINPVHMLLC